MKLVDFSTRRPVSVFIFAVAAVVFGAVAFQDLATDLLPDITYPSVTVRTTWEGTAPVEVESLLTRPVENAVGIVNNVVRVTIQALAGVLGGTQSLHTDSFDEALALPSDEAVTIALRTQQIIAEESGVANTIDPLAGSYFIEALTDQIEQGARDYIHRIDELGGAVRAIEIGFQQRSYRGDKR